MKKTNYLLPACVGMIFLTFAFTSLDSTDIECSDDYVTEIDNANLHDYVEDHFIALIDDVHSITLFYDDEAGFYYRVQGVKNSISANFNLLIDEDDARNERYTRIDFNWVRKHVNSDLDQIIYCNEYPPILPCAPTHNGFVCGIWSQLLQQCI